MAGNLTSGQLKPGFYSYVDYNSAGGGTAPTLRTLIWGSVKSGGTRVLNQPFLPASQQDVDDGCGRGSELASWYASSVSQPEAQGAEVWVMPVAAPSGGVAPTYKLRVYVSNTNPAKPGTLTLWIKSQKVAEVGFDSSDTNSSIATNLSAAINLNLDLPITAGVVSDAVTLTYAHKGTTGEDLPLQCDISPAGSGVQLSPGQIVCTTSATGAGTIRVSTGALTVSTSLSGGESASGVASAIVASWNANGYPLTAAVDGGAPSQANLFFVNGKVVRRLSAAIVTTTGTTLNLGSGATDGAGNANSLTYNGTLGTGAPSLTLALSNLANLGMFRAWAAPWLDVATIGALATNIEASSDGSVTGQKQQCLTIGDPFSSSSAGAIGPACSPNLTTSAPHYAILRCEDAAVQGMDVAVRVAAARASKWQEAPQFNWNAFQIKGNDRAPILLPDGAPTPAAQNTDLRTYGLAPVVKGDSGNLEIVKGRTTSLVANKVLWAWSAEAQAAYHASDLPQFLKSRFEGTSTVRFSEPKAAGIIDAASIEAAVRERMRFWEANGNFDGADALAPFVKATPDPNNPFRFNIRVPESPVLDLDQIVDTHQYTSPPPA